MLYNFFYMHEVLTVTSFIILRKKLFFWTTLLTPGEPQLKQLQADKLLGKKTKRDGNRAAVPFIPLAVKYFIWPCL